MREGIARLEDKRCDLGNLEDAKIAADVQNSLFAFARAQLFCWDGAAKTDAS
jgi:hypothetical protein